MEITIKPELIKELSVEGGKLLLKSKAEEELMKLLNMKDMIEEAIEEVKKSITESGKKISPDFKGFMGNTVKGYLKKTGFKYEVINEEFLKETVRTFPDTEKIEDYKKEKGKLPDGVTESERKEILVLSVNKGRALP